MNEQKPVGCIVITVIVLVALVFAYFIGPPNEADVRRRNIEWEAKQRIEQENEAVRRAIREAEIQMEMKRQRGF